MWKLLTNVLKSGRFAKAGIWCQCELLSLRHGWSTKAHGVENAPKRRQRNRYFSKKHEASSFVSESLIFLF